jgi:hypothetical protein
MFQAYRIMMARRGRFRIAILKADKTSMPRLPILPFRMSRLETMLRLTGNKSGRNLVGLEIGTTEYLWLFFRQIARWFPLTAFVGCVEFCPLTCFVLVVRKGG